MKQILSKSKYKLGLSCPKLLWMSIHEPDKVPPVDESTQFMFDQGNEVGKLAQKLFPGGTEVPYGRYAPTVKATELLLKKNKPIYEASLLSGNGYCRVDILVPVGKQWDIIEVKQGTSAKKEYLDDVAFQRYVFEGAGLKIRRCHLMHINNEYVKKGPINPKKLLQMEDVTEEVSKILPQVEDNLNAMLKMLQGKKPKPVYGTDCIAPKDCEVCDFPDNSVLDLYRFSKKAFPLLNQGIIKIKDVPKTVVLSPKQKIQWDVAKSGKIHIDKEQIKKFLSTLKYPLYFVDFETFSPAIPFFEGTRPFQKIPFQVSIHIVEKPGMKPRHVEYLAEGTSDPRPGVIKALKEIGPKGSIIAYNAVFEIAAINGLLEAFPKEKWLGTFNGRYVDLLVPFRNFWYYNPKQQGSASLKDVLPALTGISYEHLEISDGDAAGKRFFTVNYKEKRSDPKLRKALLIYCGLDTESMIEIIEKLTKNV